MYTLLDGPAAKAIKDIEIADLNILTGEVKLFDRLDERFPPEEAHDRMGEALEAAFSLRGVKGEKTASYIGRGRMAFQMASKEGVTFPSEAQGYLVLKGMRLGKD